MTEVVVIVGNGQAEVACRRHSLGPGAEMVWRDHGAAASFTGRCPHYLCCRVVARWVGTYLSISVIRYLAPSTPLRFGFIYSSSIPSSPLSPLPPSSLHPSILLHCGNRFSLLTLLYLLPTRGLVASHPCYHRSHRLAYLRLA